MKGMGMERDTAQFSETHVTKLHSSGLEELFSAMALGYTWRRQRNTYNVMTFRALVHEVSAYENAMAN